MFKGSNSANKNIDDSDVKSNLFNKKKKMYTAMSLSKCNKSSLTFANQYKTTIYMSLHSYGLIISVDMLINT